MILQIKWLLVNYFIAALISGMFTSIYPQPLSPSKDKQNKPVKYPEDIQVILRSDRIVCGNLYVANVEAAQNPQVIDNLQIGAILTLVKDHAPSHPKQLVKYTKIIALSEQNDQIYPYLDQCVDFIGDKLKLTNVLVHCVAGVNRSAAVVIAYLMRELKLSLTDAYTEVKSRRKIISPTPQVMQQLMTYQQDILSRSPRAKLSPSRLKTFSQKGEKDRLQVASQKSNYFLSKLNTSKGQLKDVDDIKSHRAHQSCKTKQQNANINISVIAPRFKTGINPEESFLSRPIPKDNSVLNKSFITSRLPSKTNQVDLSYCQTEGNEIPTLSKKESASRNDFTKKIGRIDIRNMEINSKIANLNEKYEQQERTDRAVFETELQEISQMKSHLHSQISERKSKLASFHDKTMDNFQVRDYILTNYTK